MPANFTIILATNTISGTVTDNHSNPISNVQLFGNATIDGISFNANATTDNNGNYSMNVAPGLWSMGVSCNNLPQGYVCPNNLTVNVSTNNVVTNIVLQTCGTVEITTSSPLPIGETGFFYGLNLQAQSCNQNFTWQQTAGTLPGLSVQANGFLGGMPSAAGVYNFTVRVTDGNNATTNQIYSLTISNGLSMTTGSLPNGTNGLSYSKQLSVVNGVPPYNWTISSGTLPANLSLSSSGLISGNATSTGNFSFTAQVTDNAGYTLAEPLTLSVVSTNIPTLAIATGGSGIFVLWPASAGTNFTLETTTNVATGPWVPATGGIPQTAYMFTNSAPGAIFFRLQQ